MKYLTTLLLLMSFNAHAYNGIDTVLTGRSLDAADVRVTITSDSSKVTMLKNGYLVQNNRVIIRSAISSSSLNAPKAMAHKIAIDLYYKGIVVDTIKIVSTTTYDIFKVDVNTSITVEPVDLI